MDTLIIFLAAYLFIAVVLLTGWVWLNLPRRLKIELTIAIFIAGILALVMSKIAGRLYYHPRPFVTEHVKPLVAHGADNSFPSEHALLTMTLTTLIYYYNKRLAWLSFLLTLGVGAGRVWAHVHAPVDILAGLIIGILAGSLGYWLAKQIKLPKTPAAAKTPKAAP